MYVGKVLLYHGTRLASGTGVESLTYSDTEVFMLVSYFTSLQQRSTLVKQPFDGVLLHLYIFGIP